VRSFPLPAKPILSLSELASAGALARCLRTRDAFSYIDAMMREKVSLSRADFKDLLNIIR
jgi:hypothetical protein